MHWVIWHPLHALAYMWRASIAASLSMTILGKLRGVSFRGRLLILFAHQQHIGAIVCVGALLQYHLLVRPLKPWHEKLEMRRLDSRAARNAQAWGRIATHADIESDMLVLEERNHCEQHVWKKGGD